MGTQAPRSESLIKKSMLESIQNNPAFSSLQTNIRFKKVVKKLL